MAHFVKVDNGIVVDGPIVADSQEWCDSNLPGRWVQTSYNTQANKHLLGGTPFRANYAGVGYTYNEVDDVFYGPQPYPSWVLDKVSYTWKAPVPMPPVSDKKEIYVWDEQIKDWVILNETEIV